MRGLEFGRSAGPMDATFFQKHDPVRDPENAAQLVGDNDVSDALIALKIFDQMVDGVGVDGIEAGVRLVEKHAARFVDNGAGEGRTLAHPTG